MDISIFLARMLGIIFVLMPIIVWFDESKVESLVEVIKKKNFLFAFGVFTLLFGSVIVSCHSLWLFNWKLVVTLVGWFFLLIGIASFISSSTTSKVFSLILENKLLLRGLLIILFIVGLYLFRISLIQ